MHAWYDAASICHVLDMPFHPATLQAYEPLLYKYGVDLIITGHVHGYERTKPVYNFKGKCLDTFGLLVWSCC